jgi:peptide methionine sulfoxide reductase msrA/msrB
MTYNSLSREEERVIVGKATEAPFSGKYNNFYEEGVYTCRRCSAPLYLSNDKFKSGCGWPSFDDEIAGAVRRIVDADGVRTEIVCAQCGAHLGHVFKGEGFTNKNTRHCVNSLSLSFIPQHVDVAYFAGGCFWGVEYLFEKKKGVISAVSGYMGGTTSEPSYREVCSGKSGHVEAVQVIYDREVLSYQDIVRYFFEIHDPTQADGQGLDVGSQYLSYIFYKNEDEKSVALSLREQLQEKGYKVMTNFAPVSQFWRAEEYHQDYYTRNGKQPYCHAYVKRF